MKPGAARFDRAAVMRDAHKRYRDGRRLGLGWTFGRCLSTAWAAARERQANAERQARALRLQREMTLAGYRCRIYPAGRDLPPILRMGGGLGGQGAFGRRRLAHAESLA